MGSEPKQPSNLMFRFLIGIPAGTLAVCLLAYGNISLLLFVIVAAVLALREFWRLTGVEHRKAVMPLSHLGYVAAVLLLITSWAYPSGSFDVLLAVCLPLLFVAMLVAKMRGAENYLREVSVVSLGVIYIAGLLSFIFKLRNFQMYLEEAGMLSFSNAFFHNEDMIHLTLFPVLAGWCCDTAAFFSGKFFGKSQLAPNISPKKTVTGLVGGMIGSATGVTIYAYMIGLVGQVQVYELIAFGLLAGAFSQLGDLAVSAIKREAHIKDSGRMLGAHGGVLDRIDGFLFALPASYLFFLLVLG